MNAPHATLNSSSPIPTNPSVPTGTSTSHTSQHGYDLGLLTLRLVLGLAMAAHGSQKLFGWFGGNGLEGTAQFFTSVGYPSGRTMALVGGLAEMAGGLGLAVGLLTPLAGAAVLGTMINVFAVAWDGGFFAPEGIEYAVVLAAGATCLTLTGPGRYAVDQLLPGLRVHRLARGVGALVLALVCAGAVLLTRA